MNIYESQLDGVVHVVEFTPTRESEELPYGIDVPMGSCGFTLGIGHVTDGTFRIPDNVYVQLRREGEVIGNQTDTDKESATFGPNGLVSFIGTDPTPGKWELLIQHKEPAAFTVNVAVFRRPLIILRSFVVTHRCRACKASIKALLFAVLAKLTAGAVAALDLHHLAGVIANLSTTVLAFIAKMIGISTEALQAVLGVLADTLDIKSPLDWFARRICERLGLCRPQVSTDD